MSATLYITREFTRGTLKGLFHMSRITYPTPEACIAWVTAINRKHARGKLDYRIVDRSFQNYAR